MNEVVVLTPSEFSKSPRTCCAAIGLAKATVVDVARALDVSHGSVYRHFPSKASLRQAVAKRWLDRANAPLQKIAEDLGPCAGPAREAGCAPCSTIKYKKVCEDPEMFATYLTLAQEACEAVKAHKERLVDQVAHILADGVKQGAFQVADVKVIRARGVRRHHPLPPSRPFRRMERPATRRRGSTPCWRYC